jgi:hypothetical protein
MFFSDPDRDQNIFDWDRHRNLFLKGPRPRPRPKTFFRRDRDQNFFSLGPGPKMTGPAHVYSRQYPIPQGSQKTGHSFLLCIIN